MEGPTGRRVTCPECDARAVALVPRRSTIVSAEGEADGKVVVNCRNCGERFYVYFRTR